MQSCQSHRSWQCQSAVTKGQMRYGHTTDIAHSADDGGIHCNFEPAVTPSCRMLADDWTKEPSTQIEHAHVRLTLSTGVQVRCEDAGIGLTLNRHHFRHHEVLTKLDKLWGNESFVAALQYHHKLNMQGKGPVARCAHFSL